MSNLIKTIILTLLFPIQSFSQGFDTYLSLGPANPNWGTGTIFTNVLADSNFILFSGFGRRDGMNGSMPMIGATDYQGNLLWWKGLSFDSTKYIDGHSLFYNTLVKVSADKYVMAALGNDGTIYANNLIKYYPYLLLFDSQGDTIKLSPIPSYNDSLDFPSWTLIFGICIGDNKSIVLTGRYSNVYQPSSSDTGGLYIAQFDSNGVFQWKKHYYSQFGNQIDPAYGGFKILPANEGNGYLISSYKASMDTLTSSIFHFVRIDSIGNILWEKTLPKANTLFKYGDNFERADFIKAMDGSGYYFNSREYADTSNMFFRFMSYIGKIDNLGNVAWAKTIDFEDKYPTPLDMVQMDNGDLVFNIKINDPYTPVPNNITGSTSLLCTDSLGNIKWHKSYVRIPCSAGAVQEPFLVMSKSPYNTIALAGYEGNETSFILPNCYTTWDVLAKLALVDSLGRRNIEDTTYLYFNPTVTEVEYPTGITLPAKDLKKSIDIYPNPAQQNLFISIKEKGNYQIEVSDISGRKQYEKKLKADITQINIENWKSGIYFIKVFEDNTYLGSFKLVKP